MNQVWHALPRLLMVLTFLSSSVCGAAVPFDLVSDQEVLADRKVSVIDAKAVPSPDAPSIEVASPDLHVPVEPPVDILVKWAAKEGATVDVASLRIYYGRLHLDVTQRILTHAHVSETGLEATNARLPAGQHRLLVLVADSRGREAQREIVFEVQGAR